MIASIRTNGLSSTTTNLLGAVIIIGLLHHADHVLRVDHSGWPFRPKVTPFTYSLLAYPILLSALFGSVRYFWARWTGLALGTGFTLFAHVRIESPQMQYAMWAYNRSLEPRLWSIRNLCGVESGMLGWAAVSISMLLNAMLVVATMSMFIDGKKRRRGVCMVRA